MRGEIVEHHLEMRGVDGFAQIVVGAELDGLDDVGNPALPGNHDGRDVEASGVEFLQDFEAVLADQGDERLFGKPATG